MNRRRLLQLSTALLGGAVSTSVSRALLAGVTAAAESTDSPFDAHQSKAVRLLCEMIIPTTDTPGAVAAGVPDFIGTIFGQWYTDDERQSFLDGLAALDEFCQQQASSSFVTAHEHARIAALQELERLAQGYTPPGVARLTPQQAGEESTPFFIRIRELVVLGYYTSEVGCKQELAWLPMPGRFDGDYDFSKIGRHFTH